ncbi:hypothetical protein D9M68_294560 [compost metagenome]
MSSTPSSRVVRLQQWNPERALEDLNRITGLSFARWPESLVAAGATNGAEEERVADRANPLEAVGR